MPARKLKSGQSLIELLIATAVFGIVIVPFLSSLVNLTASQVKNRHQLQATQFAREGLEIIYNIGVNTDNWDGLLDLSDPGKHFRIASTDEPTLEEGEETIGVRFTRVILLEQDGDNLKVRCNLSWQERGKDEEVELEAYLIDLGSFDIET